MPEINGFKEAQERLGGFRWGEFDILEKLTLEVIETETGEYAQVVDLQLKTSKRKPCAHIDLRCWAVNSLKLAIHSSAEIQISGFDIVNIMDRQWGAMRWQVEDYEEGVIDFYCQDIVIVSAR